MDKSTPPEVPTSPPPISSASNKKKAKSWPDVIGAIAIIFGILGILNGFIQPFQPFNLKMQMAIQSSALEDVGMDPVEIPEEAMSQWLTMTIVVGVVYLIVGILLLIGGLSLIKRKPGSRPTLVIWSVVKILAGVFATWVSVKYASPVMNAFFKATMDMGAEADGIEMPDFAGIMEGAVKIGYVTGLIWIAALPVFFLIWFSKKRIKKEVAGWR